VKIGDDHHELQGGHIEKADPEVECVSMGKATGPFRAERGVAGLPKMIDVCHIAVTLERGQPRVKTGLI
jgi:hypothetical protein